MMRFLCCLLISLPAFSQPQELVFALTSMNIVGVEHADICYLDRAQQIEGEMNNYLQHRGYLTRDAIKENLHPDFEKLSQLAICKQQARTLGITKLPAIVFDNHYVVYGQTDIYTARHLYQRWKSQHE